MTNAVVVIVVGVNGDGQREVLDLRVDTEETGGMERVLRRPDRADRGRPGHQRRRAVRVDALLHAVNDQAGSAAVQAQFKPCDADAVMGSGYKVQTGISTWTLLRRDVMR